MPKCLKVKIEDKVNGSRVRIPRDVIKAHYLRHGVLITAWCRLFFPYSKLTTVVDLTLAQRKVSWIVLSSSLPLFLSISLTDTVSLSFFSLSLTLILFHSLSLPHFRSLSLSLSLSLALSLTVSLCLCKLSVAFSLSVYLHTNETRTLVSLWEPTLTKQPENTHSACECAKAIDQIS